MTARALIVQALLSADRPLPIHEINIPGVSQNSIGSRLPEMAKDGIVEGVKIPGKQFKAWRLKPAQQSLALELQP